MPQATYASTSVEVNDQGFFSDPSQWSEAMVPEIAATVGIDEVSDRHMEVIRFQRQQFEENGDGVSVRALSKLSGVPVKELYALFPKGPAKLSSLMAGIPKPHGCI
jgi:TusE/DsrC/DsvC family sulfur relay protein